MNWQQRVITGMLFCGVALSVYSPLCGIAQNQGVNPAPPPQAAPQTAPQAATNPAEQTVENPFADPNAMGESSDPKSNLIDGPVELDLGPGLAILNLDMRYTFLDARNAPKFLKEVGNPVTGRELGVLFPREESKPWYLVLKYDPVGHVMDTPAPKIDPDDLLERIKDITEARNKEKGMAPLHILSWEVPPEYDATSHRLVWALLFKDDKSEAVNYQGAVLGKSGYVTATMVAPRGNTEDVLGELEGILANFTYQEGYRYEDYVKGQGKLASMEVPGIVLVNAGIDPPEPGIMSNLWQWFLSFLEQYWIGLLALAVGLAIFWKDIFMRD